MKLVRYGAPGREKPGMLDAAGRIRDLSKIVPDIAGEVLSPQGLAKLRKLKAEKLPLVRGTPRLGPCVGKVGNFIAIGLNYSDHAAEAGMPLPSNCTFQWHPLRRRLITPQTCKTSHRHALCAGGAVTFHETNVARDRSSRPPRL